MRYETLLVHAGYETGGQALPYAVPIRRTAAHTFRDSEHGARLFAPEEEGHIDPRLMNPTVEVFEKRIAALEGGAAAVATASGHVARLVALCSLMRAGDNFVASPCLYGGSHNLFCNTLANFGIECRIANGLEPIDFEMLVDHNTKAIYLETISDSNLAVPDLEGLCALAHAYGVPLIADNTPAGAGYLCRPIQWGADIVVQSAAKWIGGHGNSMGGVIVDAGRFDWSGGKFQLLSQPSPGYHGMNYCERFGPLAFIARCREEGLRDMGPCLSPFNAFLLLQGVQTLSLRMERESATALALARWFKARPEVEAVFYPGLEDDPWHAQAAKFLQNGFGGVLMVTLKGDGRRAARFVDALRLVSHVSNVGDARTLIVQPSATTHSQFSPEAQKEAGIHPAMLRISTGLEHMDDLTGDFENAFAATA